MTAKAVLYTRVSTEGQADEGTSLASQEAACLKRAAELCAEVVAVYSDPGVSGTLYWARPGIQAALTFIETGKADTLIIYNLSRFSRDRKHQSEIKERVERAGGRLVFCEGNFDDSPEGELMFHITGDFAHYEAQVIRKRTMNGRRRRAEEGLQPCRAKRPFGYNVVTKADVLTGRFPAGTDGTYQVVDGEAPWVREIFTRYAGGASLRELSRLLYTNGVPTTQGGMWHPYSLKTIIQNPVYTGSAAYGKRERVKDDNRIHRGLNPSYVRRAPQDKQTAIPAPALIDRDTWNLCQTRLSENKETLSGNPARRYLLSGLLKCPVCKRGMFGSTEKAGKHYYRCRDFNKASNAAQRICNPLSIRAEPLEKRLTDGIVYAASRPEAVEAALRAHAEHKAASQTRGYTVEDRDRLQKELHALE